MPRYGFDADVFNPTGQDDDQPRRRSEKTKVPWMLATENWRTPGYRHICKEPDMPHVVGTDECGLELAAMTREELALLVEKHMEVVHS